MTENVTFTFLPLSHYPLLFAFPLDTFRPTQSVLYVASHLCTSQRYLDSTRKTSDSWVCFVSFNMKISKSLLFPADDII